MPKETIKDVGVAMYDIHVGWSEETVQLGVGTTDGKPILEALGEMTEANNIWSTLDPESIDKLIRVLNKARYKAYPDA